ncbi:hypothetical protein QBC40DRAFT_276655 [Triangularia verruculosa]|uniref:Uncharacterized protein n=1 Tax=Triangularia verruculosa TaxID=2587418 RepID=A0AAN6XML9_9PEZI|nr:hypothetical protein QBC40DRAFT_276655 [Triangularia verruculosa]
MEYDPFNPYRQPKGGPGVAVTEAYTFDLPAEKEQQPGIARTQAWWRAWWLEVCSAAATVGCSVAIIAILSAFNRRPITDWTDKGKLAEIISLPTTLSILATAANATTTLILGSAISQYKWVYFKTKTRSLADLDLIDGSSRGTLWKCAELLLKRTRTLASLGAIAMILSLAVGPFYQQTVQLVEWDIPTDDGKASFGLARQYIATGRSNNAFGGIDGRVLPAFAVEPGTADVAMQGAIYRGLFNLDLPARFNCTANCTWPDPGADKPYVSLGFRSDCANVTDAALRGSGWDDTIEGSARAINITTPGNLTLNTIFVHTAFQPVVIVESKSLLSSVNPPDSAAHHDFTFGTGTSVGASVARIAVFRAEADNLNYNLFSHMMHITECDISLAAYRYSGVSASSGNFTIGKAELIRLDSGTIDEDMVFKQPIATFSAVVDSSGTTIPLKVALPDIGALVALFISTRFTGTVYLGETPDAGRNHRPSGMGDAFLGGNITDTLITERFEKMAESMTLQVRSTDEIIARGISVYAIVHYKVEWAWLALPLAVQLITLVFFFWVLIRNHRNTLQHWKDSALAIISHSLQAVDEDIHRVEMVGPMHVEKIEDLKIWAKGTKAKLL